MCFRVNQGLKINIDNNVFKERSIKDSLVTSNSSSVLSTGDVSSIKKSEKTPFTQDINAQMNNEIEKLNFNTQNLEALPDFNVTPLKVGIAVEQKQASFYIPNGTLYVENEEGKKEIGTFSDKNFVVKNENNGLSLYEENGKLIGNYKGKITLDGNLTPIAINGKKYRGELEVIVNPQKPSTLHIVNEVMLEDYLKSVVPSESPASWPLESLKAQAVAARTYATGNWKRRENLGFDLMPTVADQMYTGIEAERDSSNQAVKETTGEILVFQGKPINALFFSCSGGYTDSASEVWNTNEYPYIQPVKDFDQNAPKYKWEKSFSNQDLQAGVKKLGEDVGEIKSIKGIEFTPQKRVKKVEVIGTKGRVVLDSNKFRFAVGLNSTLWEAEPEKNLLRSNPKNFVFKGGGWGHGLGMSQWGANQMSKEGKEYKEILMHYYTGVNLSNILNETKK